MSILIKKYSLWHQYKGLLNASLSTSPFFSTHFSDLYILQTRINCWCYNLDSVHINKEDNYVSKDNIPFCRVAEEAGMYRIDIFGLEGRKIVGYSDAKPSVYVLKPVHQINLCSKSRDYYNFPIWNSWSIRILRKEDTSDLVCIIFF